MEYAPGVTLVNIQFTDGPMIEVGGADAEFLHDRGYHRAK